MNLQHNRKSLSTTGIVPAALVASLSIAALSIFTGCSSSDDVHDDAVGHTKTTEKRVIDTPTEKTTITETHEKETKYVPR